MGSFKNGILLFCCFIASAIKTSAQLPVCSNGGNGIIYTIHNDTIFNYNLSQAISSTNPGANSISLPVGANGLAFGNNLNSSSPPSTFYTVVSGNYFYYNGTSWVNTGHTAGALNIGAGGAYVYAVDPSGTVYQYDGTGNASLLTSISSFAGVADIVVDCAGNFYLLNTGGSPWLHEYNSAGTQIKSWSINGTIGTGGAGLAIVGNNVYYGSSALYKSAVSNNSINSSLTGYFSAAATDFATCPIGGLHHAHTNIHNITYCSGSSAVQLSAIGTGPFSWSVISGTAVITGFGNNIGVTATTNSSILLSDTSFCGGYMPEDTTVINVSAPPSVSDSSNSPLCSGQTLHLGAASNPAGATYQWSGPNGFFCNNSDTSIQNVSISFSGYYYVTAIVSGCSTTDTLLININPTPAIPATGSNSPVCAGDTLKLSATDSTTGVTFNWTGPLIFSTSTQNPFIPNSVLADSGNYYVSASLGSCNAYDSVFVSIIQRPALPATNSNSPVCSGDTLHLSSSCTTNNVVYSWTGPGNFSSNSVNPQRTNIALADSGYYVAYAMMSGCSTKDSVRVSVNPTPVIQSAGSNSPLCTGNTLSLNSITNFAGASYSWSGPNNFSDTSQNPGINNIQLQAAGMYYVFAKAGNCTSKIDSTFVTISPSLVPTVMITSVPSPIVPGIPAQFFANVINGGTNTLYQWRKNGQNLPGYFINPCYITIAAGEQVSVWIQSNATCASPDTAVSNVLGIPGTGGVSSNLLQGQIKIYPNPASNVIYIDAPVKVNARLYNTEGKQMMLMDQAKQIDISHLANGNYWIRLFDEQNELIKTEKLVKVQ